MESVFHRRLATGILLFDGGFGTSLYERGVHLGRCFDALNLEDPAMVTALHAEYREAGAQVLQSNTFGANAYKLRVHHLEEKLEEINRRGVALVRDVAGDDRLVAGAIGPLGVKIEPWGPTSREEVRLAFAQQGKALLAEGVDLFALETFASPEELSEAVAGLKALTPDIPVLAQLTPTAEGRTLFGTPIEDAMSIVVRSGPDAVGLNCTIGPELMLECLERIVGTTDLPIAVQPNAGFPKLIEERFFYLSSPEYFARYGRRFVEAGARIVGGCCGTTPAHINALSQALRSVAPSSFGGRTIATAPSEVASAPTIPMAEKSNLGRKIAHGIPVATVELLPPRGWGLTHILQRTREMELAGFDAVNIPDGPRATARISPLATAVRIHSESEQIEPVLHYVCRDRNLLGMQADLLGAYALGIRNLLLITGDPPVQGDYPDATAVFDVDSIGLTNLVHRLNQGIDVGNRKIGKPTGFLIGVGGNPTAVSLEREVERFYWKVDAGAEYAVTQPVFDLEALFHFLDATGEFNLPVLAGIWPLQSLRNAEFLNNEVPGVSIPAPIMERMRAVAGQKEAEREEGLAIALEMAREALKRAAGLQISAPFNRGEGARRLLQALHADLHPGDAPGPE